MSFAKMSKVALLLALMTLCSSQVMCFQGRPLVAIHRRHLLLHSSEEAADGKMMTGGTLMADADQGKGGGALGNLEDARPTGPGHSPGAGHAVTNNGGVGRKLLGVK
uniref:Uncharacterized protein n=1 Tax=Avena sativa TaxID=4498 RepID=A0ACD5XGA8_AVESA